MHSLVTIMLYRGKKKDCFKSVPNHEPATSDFPVWKTTCFLICFIPLLPKLHASKNKDFP